MNIYDIQDIEKGLQLLQDFCNEKDCLECPLFTKSGLCRIESKPNNYDIDKIINILDR